MSYNHTWLTHDYGRERLKKEIGKVKKIHFTQQEALEVLDSENHKPLYDAFATFAFKYANQLSSSDKQGLLSYYTDDFFMDIYQEGMVALTLALQRYDREKNDNLIGYCMAYVKGSMLYFKQRYLNGVLTIKRDSSKKEKDKKTWANVDNFGSFDDVNEQYSKLVEKTYSLEEDNYNETLVMDFILQNNHIFDLTVDEKKILVLYFSDDTTILKEVAEQLGISLNKMTYIYRSCRNKIRKHKQLIEEILL